MTRKLPITDSVCATCIFWKGLLIRNRHYRCTVTGEMTTMLDTCKHHTS